MFIGLCTIANAQYKPTEKDLGKDCPTENGKLGTWKNFTVTEKQDNTNSKIILLRIHQASQHLQTYQLEPRKPMLELA